MNLITDETVVVHLARRSVGRKILHDGFSPSCCRVANYSQVSDADNAGLVVGVGHEDVGIGGAIGDVLLHGVS